MRPMISATFVYTFPTNGASIPKIIPNNKETATMGIKTSVNLLKNFLIDLSESLSFFILNITNKSI